MGSSPDINYPAQPSYGESMAEALKAQAEFLKGTGDFASVGSLESLLPLEESIRKKTAQTDTDFLGRHCWVIQELFKKVTAGRRNLRKGVNLLCVHSTLLKIQSFQILE